MCDSSWRTLTATEGLSNRCPTLCTEPRNLNFNVSMALFSVFHKCFLRVANLVLEDDRANREDVVKHLYKLCAEVKCNQSVPVMRAWHGTSTSVLPNVMATGFAAISKKDSGLCACFLAFRSLLLVGWFGKGVYLSSNPDYAKRYCAKPSCLIMCCMLEPVLLGPEISCCRCCYLHPVSHHGCRRASWSHARQV